jgi:excinuclease ABC subunit B
MEQIRTRAAVGERVLVTTLTKRMAEDLSAYLTEQGISCKWLHSELNAFERVELLRDLRQGRFDVLVGVNLLREGLDLPEVSLVAILDADKEGFLRSETSLIQTIGRSARNVNAKVILYADTVTDSMKRAMEETKRRRTLQEEYNRKHNITPETIRKNIRVGIEAEAEAHREANAAVGRNDEATYVTEEYLSELEGEMMAAAEALEFEKAAAIRDRIVALKEGDAAAAERPTSQPARKRRSRRSAKTGGKVPRPKKL